MENTTVDEPIVEGDRVRLKQVRGPHMIVTHTDAIWATVLWYDSEDRMQNATIQKSLLVRSPIKIQRGGGVDKQKWCVYRRIINDDRWGRIPGGL